MPACAAATRPRCRPRCRTLPRPHPRRRSCMHRRSGRAAITARCSGYRLSKSAWCRALCSPGAAPCLKLKRPALLCERSRGQANMQAGSLTALGTSTPCAACHRGTTASQVCEAPSCANEKRKEKGARTPRAPTARCSASAAAAARARMSVAREASKRSARHASSPGTTTSPRPARLQAHHASQKSPVLASSWDSQRNACLDTL